MSPCAHRHTQHEKKGPHFSKHCTIELLLVKTPEYTFNKCAKHELQPFPTVFLHGVACTHMFVCFF